MQWPPSTTCHTIQLTPVPSYNAGFTLLTVCLTPRHVLCRVTDVDFVVLISVNIFETLYFVVLFIIVIANNLHNVQKLIFFNQKCSTKVLIFLVIL